MLRNEFVELFGQFLIVRGLILGLEQIIDLSMAIFLTHFPFLLAHLIADAFLGRNDRQVLLVVFGPYRGGAFEHHVLEKVRGAGDARPFIRASNMRHPPTRDRGFVVPLDH